MSELLYLFLHFTAAVIAGVTILVLYYKRVVGRKAFLLYIGFLVVFLVIAGAIGELGEFSSTTELVKWVGISTFIITYIATTFLLKNRIKKQGSE